MINETSPCERFFYGYKLLKQIFKNQPQYMNLIDKVSQNNEVELNFPSLNRSVTPRLKGRLVTISADRIEDSKQPNIFYFKAKAIFEDQQMCKKMNIKVGMLTQVFIKTGNRSFLSYLIKPLMDRFNNSLN